MTVLICLDILPESDPEGFFCKKGCNVRLTKLPAQKLLHKLYCQRSRGREKDTMQGSEAKSSERPEHKKHHTGGLTLLSEVF